MILNFFADNFFFENIFLVNFYISYQNFCFFIKVLDLLPEIILLVFILFGLLNIFSDKKYSIFQYYTWLLYLIIVFFALIFSFHNANEVSIIFGFSLIQCWYTKCAKLFVLVLTFIVLAISQNKLIIDKKLTCVLEFPLIIGFSLLFLFFLLSIYDFFGFYLALEGLSLTLYVLAGMLNHSVISIESAIKYFALGAIATGFLLFGISLLFGVVGSLDFLELQLFFSSGFQNYKVMSELKIAIFFILFGFFFKIAAFPCHWWVADVYEGIWTPVTAYFAIVIKVGLLLLFFRLLYNIFFNIIYTFQLILIVVSLGSMWVGTFGALTQVRIKRFIAYTSISQVGFIMLGLASLSLGGLISALLYLFIYAITSVAFFTLLLNTNHAVTKKNPRYFSELNYLSVYNREFANYLNVFLLSMAGVPPLGGFIGKLFIYISAIDAGLELVVFVSLLLSLVSTYYYLNVIQYIWFIRVYGFKPYYFNLSVLSKFLLKLTVAILSYFIVLVPFFFPFVTFLACSCIWPFFF